MEVALDFLLSNFDRQNRLKESKLRQEVNGLEYLCLQPLPSPRRRENSFDARYLSRAEVAFVLIAREGLPSG
ncbi:hypothetical protein WN51_11813 [Melipona quadrifasciata]|uniref:Uncharacterized protein n=1 Tax=Melipona quadrifasciata TaxID=166423 RepID=A0A0N0BHI0_9HYME|nr:hypothetical protein WN51_11813 [Melipona quadrifasciata]